jgi:ADP-ribosylglycohydrolase
MRYPKPLEARLLEQVNRWAELKAEHGAKGVERVLRRLERALKGGARDLMGLREDARLARREPSGLAAIRALRPPGPRRLWRAFDGAAYAARIEGALLGRMAGCTLGAPVEGQSIWRMENRAKSEGQPFPPRDYWVTVMEPYSPRYGTSPQSAYTRGGMDGVPVDDDIAYTLLGLLVVEEFGPGFTVAESARAWLKYLPMACTAEAAALANLKAGVPARRAAEKNNPYSDWIGADIRSDPWGYMAPGWPEMAADMAWRDAFVSHRRAGLHGAMFFSAAIAAALAVDDPVEALRIGLTEVPRQSRMAEAVRWALRTAPKIEDFRQARQAVDRRFAGMHHVHTLNNACLTVFGVAIGGRDFTRVIGETVAMGLDNDCTAATAGSLVGAVVGRNGIPERWYKRFDNTIRSYLIGRPVFQIDDVLVRLAAQAARVHGEGRLTGGR